MYLTTLCTTRQQCLVEGIHQNMGTEGGSSSETILHLPDKYRVFLHLEPPTIDWRHGKPPTYETVNQLFEDGRTKVFFFTLLPSLYSFSLSRSHSEFQNNRFSNSFYFPIIPLLSLDRSLCRVVWRFLKSRII